MHLIFVLSHQRLKFLTSNFFQTTVYDLQLHVYVNCFIGTDRPTPRLFNKYVRDDIAPKWEDLGNEFLDDKKQSILEIIAENKPDVQHRCTELFNHWLSVDVNTSWDKLIKALEIINQKNLAENIRRIILKGIVVSPY